MTNLPGRDDMMDGRDRRRPSAPEGRSDSLADMRSGRVLAVALNPETLTRLPPNVLAPNLTILSSSYEELSNFPLAGPLAPALVLSPLLTPAFDALDLARVLSQHGYRGRYLALVDRLPSANLIRREVAAQSPNLNFDVIVMDGSSPLHSL